ncbi:MAG: hypothetical protein K8R87_07565 [Verrucomicrobia bacterium]|nr:hypothetical protein [Verrucomicrobiota bacterium]
MDDGAGNFWGTTDGGPVYTREAGMDGTVFKIAKATGVLTTVAEFTGHTASNMRSRPVAALVSDGAGNLWGTTSGGDDLKNEGDNHGTVFKIARDTGVLTTVVKFTGNGASNKGSTPKAGLVSDGAGNLWGTTTSGGANKGGTIFKIAQATGVLTTVVEFTFNGASNKGSAPCAGLVNDGAGNFWGTTKFGGKSGNGTVFKIAAGLPTKP